MSWRVIPDCTPYLLTHCYRDGTTRNTIVGPRSVYTDIDPTGRIGGLVTPLPLGLLPFPVSELVDRAFDASIIGPLAPPRPVPAIVRAALASMRPTPRRTTVEQIAAGLGVSTRHLRVVFARYVGLSPKRAARVLRFKAVFDAMQARPEVGWAVLAAAYGYFDQSHLVDEFHALVGEAPEAFRARCGREAADTVPLLPSAPPWAAV
jgi:AraC-like DNA-binding protein